MSEVALTPETISRFRRNYIETFGAPSRDDALYAAVSEGRRFAGMEHWLPFFYERLDTLFDYLPDAPFVFDHLAREALAERHTLILDHYEARKKQGEAAGMREAVPYKPVPPERLYVSPDEVGQRMPDHTAIELTPFDAPFAEGRRIFHAGAKSGRSFEQERADPSANVFDAVVKHIADIRAGGRKVVIAGWTDGSLDRLAQILAEHHLERLQAVDTLADVERLKPGQAGLAVLPIEAGFEPGASSSSPSRTFSATGWCAARRSASAAPISSPKLASLAAGDIVVHGDHGIGRFIGLKTIEAAGAPHDCLEIHYAGDGRLFLPVENIELLSRYGSEATEAVLDRLGGGAWQSRKARLKRRLLEMAGALIRIAAERQMRAAPVLHPAGRALRRVRGALPLRGDRRPADGDRRGDGGSCRPASRWTG